MLKKIAQKIVSETSDTILYKSHFYHCNNMKLRRANNQLYINYDILSPDYEDLKIKVNAWGHSASRNAFILEIRRPSPRYANNVEP